jgi:hypothetical protein
MPGPQHVAAGPFFLKYRLSRRRPVATERLCNHVGGERGAETQNSGWASVEKANSVDERKVWPGRSSVEGKFGRLGLSG